METPHGLVLVLIQEQARILGGLERGVLGKKKKWFRFFGEYLGRCEFLRSQTFLEKGYGNSLANKPDNFFTNGLRVIGPKFMHGMPLPSGQE